MRQPAHRLLCECSLGIVCSLLFVLALPNTLFAAQQQNSVKIEVDWNKEIGISKSTPTLQVVVNPLLRAGSPIHNAVFANLKDLNADFVRFVPWLPYPRLAVAEFAAPTSNGTVMPGKKLVLTVRRLSQVMPTRSRC